MNTINRSNFDSIGRSAEMSIVGQPGAEKPHRAMYEGCGAIDNWRVVQ